MEPSGAQDPHVIGHGTTTLPTAYRCTKCHRFSLVLYPHARRGKESDVRVLDQNTMISQRRYNAWAPSHHFNVVNTVVGEVREPEPMSIPEAPCMWLVGAYDVRTPAMHISHAHTAVCGHYTLTRHDISKQELLELRAGARVRHLARYNRPGHSKLCMDLDTIYALYLSWCNGVEFSLRSSGVVEQRHQPAMQAAYELGGEHSVLELVQTIEPDQLWARNTARYEVPDNHPARLGSWRPKRINPAKLALMMWSPR